MRNKTVIVILTVAALLVGFIFLFERDAMTTSEKMGRKGRVFADFKKESVSRLEITRKGKGKVVIEKETAAGGVEEHVHWRITSPKSLEADGAEVQQILSAIDFLLVDRAIQGRDKQTDPSFGLSDPVVTATFSANGKTTTFRIGGEARGEKVYLSSDGAPETVYAVGGDILTALDKGVNELRDKALVSDDLAEITTVSLKRKSDAIELKKRDDNWDVKVNSTWVLAAADQVRELIDAVEQLQADEFIADDVKDGQLSGYGLKPADIVFETAISKEKRLSVLVGKACPGERQRRYVHVAGTGTVACASDALTQVAERPLIRFQETRPAVFNAEDVVKVSLSSKGTSLTLERKEAGWQLVEKAVEVDGAAVDKLLAAITETRATTVASGEGEVVSLGEPTGEATFTLADDMGEVSLQYFDGDDTGARIRRKGEPAVLTVPTALADALRPDVLAFRAKRIKSAEPHDAVRVKVKGPTSQSVEKRDHKWTLTAPVEVTADETAVRRLTELLAETTVDSFAAPRAEASHGLTPPFAEIAVLFESVADADKGEDAKASKKEVVLILGGEAGPGKRYARIKGDDPAVFIVGDEYETAVTRPLIARDLFQVEDGRLRTLAFTTPEKTLGLTRVMDTWQTEDKTPVDTEKLGHIIADLGGVKTVSAVSFGEKEAAFGETLLTVSAGVVDEDQKESTRTFTIGQKSEDTAEDGYLARVDGVNATFVLPARIIDEMLSLVTPGGSPLQP